MDRFREFLLFIDELTLSVFDRHKLFYPWSKNASATFCEFRRLKWLRRDPMSTTNWTTISKLSVPTGASRMSPVRGRKGIKLKRIQLLHSSRRGVISRQRSIPYSTVFKTMHKCLKFHPYKISPVQHWRWKYANWFLSRMEVGNTWLSKILWIDEAEFYLNREINTHKCCIWSEANPNACLKTLLHLQNVTISCGFTASFIIGPFY